MKKLAFTLLLALLIVAGWQTTPASLSAGSPLVSLAEPVENAINAAEKRVADTNGLIAGTEKRVVWAGEPGTKTEYAVVYVHGFSASRQEVAPLPERVAQELGANLFETRLDGHGLESQPLHGVRAERWLADGAEALSVGAHLGDKLVVIGTSTGASLVLALADHPDYAAIDTLVLMSPNLGLRARSGALLSAPFAPWLARGLIGEYREFDPANADQARFWSTRYPTVALIEMKRLVDRARRMLPVAGTPRALLVYSPEDRVVSSEALLAGFARLPAERKMTHASTSTSDPGRHVLAGRILSPDTTEAMVGRIRNFILAP